MINPRTGDNIWYYPAPKDKVKDILKEGISAFERSTFTGGIHTPWIYLSTQPEENKYLEYLAIDTKDIHERCISISQLKSSSGDKLLRVHIQIEPPWIKRINNDIREEVDNSANNLGS